MKILHVIPSLGVGGTEKMLLELCRGLDPARFTNVVVALKSGGPTADSLSKIPVQVVSLESPNGFFLGSLDLPRLYIQLRRVIQKVSPDIVHTWLTRANVIGRLSANNHAVISSLRVIESEKTYHLWAERWTQKRSDIVTVNCTLLKEFAVQRIGIPEQKIKIIFNGIEVPPSHSFGRTVDNEKNRTIVFGALGRLHKQKGIDVLLKAAKLVLEQFPNCNFQIAGEGPEMNALKMSRDKLGISANKVIFRGLMEKSEFFDGIDIFVLASRWEGMPNVVMEAMAYQKPIVSTRVGGVTDLIQDKVHGLLVPSEDPKSLSDALLSLLKNKELRDKIASAAYKRAVDEFSMKKMIDSYSSLYETVLRRA